MVSVHEYSEQDVSKDEVNHNKMSYVVTDFSI